MSIRTVRFEEVKATARRTGVCPVCGRKVTLTETFTETVLDLRSRAGGVVVSTLATAAILVGVTLAYLAGMGALVGRSSSSPALCPECGRMGRVQADDKEATVRHCPWCTSVWIERKDRA